MITAADVARIVERIVALYDPDEVYLFGSHAKGTATPDSDLDLVVVRPSDEPRWLRGRDVTIALTALAHRMDLLFVTREEIAEELTDPYSVLSTIMPSARSIYARQG